MADLQFLEQMALQIKCDRQHLTDIEDELDTVNFRIREIPLKITTESSFAKIIGEEYHDSTQELENAKNRLIEERDSLTIKIREDISKFISEFASPSLVIPLDPNPKIGDDNTIFRYKSGLTFQNVFDLLSELLGLSLPLLVKDVMFSPSEIVIKVNDEYEAKEKFLSSLHEVQKTLSIKKI